MYYSSNVKNDDGSFNRPPKLLSEQEYELVSRTKILAHIGYFGSLLCTVAASAVTMARTDSMSAATVVAGMGLLVAFMAAKTILSTERTLKDHDSLSKEWAAHQRKIRGDRHRITNENTTANKTSQFREPQAPSKNLFKRAAAWFRGPTKPLKTAQYGRLPDRIQNKLDAQKAANLQKKVSRLTAILG